MLAFFNYWLHEAIEISEGEEVCPDCEGKGMKNVLKDRPAQFSSRRICQKCNGDGKLDWIEMVMGKPPLSVSGSTSSMSSSYSENEKKYKDI